MEIIISILVLIIIWLIIFVRLQFSNNKFFVDEINKLNRRVNELEDDLFETELKNLKYNQHGRNY